MPRGENLSSLPHVTDFDPLNTIMSLLNLCRNTRSTCIHKPHSLVLTRSCIIISLVVPNDILTQILHIRKGTHLHRSLNVPNLDSIIAPRRCQHIIRRRMKPNQTNLLRMPHQIHQTLRNILPTLTTPTPINRLPFLRNIPNLNSRILTTRSQHGVIEGVPLKVGNGPRVSVEGGRVSGLEATGAVVAAYVDLASAAEEGDGEVFGGGFDVLLVAGDGGEAEARVACLCLWRVAVDMPVL
mmetsp:Transcript_6337/g.14062  ORF Transcript_6337/g.14062 Transcript_6337/m.14062 type:complete len:240 (-) Transcript_6337:89-808(-)